MANQQFRIDFSEIKDNNIPEGNYEATIAKVEMRQSPGSQYPYMNWDFEITEGDFSGRHVFMTCSLNPKAAWNLKAQMIALGYPKDAQINFEINNVAPDANTLGEVIEPQLTGFSVMVNVYNEDYQGRPIPKVRDIILCHNPIDGSGPQTEEGGMKLL